ncbi:MAG TPA: glycosyltransferase family 2 protein [Chthoniobacteraceae bacterium]|jgi:glycosyltransferase involved in cell wall biosynthesis|nr:glycosyltransferase family 2 protein [Chthoniobacteraceae bacterium]
MSPGGGPLVLAVPVFNAERFLTATLESLNQQGAHVRWWLQDGGSQDRTVEIARKHARPDDVVVSESDAGQTNALNRAFRKMGGEIIGFLNGDDQLTAGAAGRVCEFFAANPQVDLVYGGVEWIDEHGTPTGSHQGRIRSLEEVLNIYDVWWNKRQWVQPEVFFRRRLFEKAGAFDERYRLAFDFDFWVRCFRADARVAQLPHPLARFRLHAAQKSSAGKEAADEIRHIVREHLEVSSTLSPTFRRKLTARLDYDRHQNSADGGGSFVCQLLRHPQWLLAPEVQARIRGSLRNARGGT